MIDPTDRETLEDLLTRYVLGELRGDDAVELEGLIAERPDLTVELQRLQRTVGLMPYAAVAAPPPDLRGRVLRAAEGIDVRADAPTSSPNHKERDPRITPISRAGRTRGGAPWRKIVGSIAALLIIALAWDGFRLRQELALQRDVTTTLQEPNVVLSFALHGTGASLAAGSAVLDLDAKKAAVAIRGLPPLPADQVYRLWARVGDEMVRCGEFKVNAEGAVVNQFTIPVDAYTEPVRALVLTAEPAISAGHPVGRTVMVST